MSVQPIHLEPARAASAHKRLEPATLASMAALAAVYFLTGKLGLQLAFLNESVSPVWPPTGIALAAVLLFGLRMWPGIWLGAFLVNLTTQDTWATSLGIATGNTLEIVAGAWLVVRFGGGAHSFKHARHILSFALFAAVLATMVAATFGVASLVWGGYVPRGHAGAVWLTWWLGDMVSAVTITPFLVTWAEKLRPRIWRVQAIEAALMMVAVLGVGLFVFCGAFPPPYNRYPLAFLCFPPLAWAAMRFGERGAVSAAFALSAIALWGTVRASGPFSVPDRNVSLVLLQMFMATITLTNLVLAAVVLERRHVQRALQQSDERLRVALAAARARAWEWNENDPPDAVPLLFDTRGQAQHIHPDDVERVVATRRESIATGLPYDTQYRVVYHDGTMRWFRSVGRAVGPRRDRRLVGIAMDVTESKQIEDALRTSQQQLALVTDSMSASVTQCSRDLKYLWASKAYLEWCGRPAEEVINRPIVDIVGPETFARLRPYFDRVLSGEVVRYEEELELPGRGRRWIHAVYTPMVDAQGVIHGWVAAIHDIDQRKRAENALKEADRRKDEFLAILAHELRNPLAPIRTAVSLLRKIGSTGAQEREFHEIIDRQVTQMARLLDDLLDVSRITSGKIVLRKERVSLQMVITHALEASRPLIEGQRHHLTVSVPPEPLLLDADLTRLAQVFANLLNNAAKYTEQEGEITVVAERDAGGAVVHIRDNGIGIPQDMLSHVFEMFVQVDGSLERTRGGLGIGLTLVQRLVALHGGRVEARSAGAMHGSEFSVYLPLVAATVEAPSAPPTTADDLPMEARMRILVADDNADSAKLLAKLLTFSGHDVRTAFDGAAAFDVVKAFAPDVALLDIGMPKLNGYELAQRIRAEVTDRRITLVAMTGWGQEEDRRRAHEAGFDHHLTKPADLDAIEKLIAGLGQTATG